MYLIFNGLLYLSEKCKWTNQQKLAKTFLTKFAAEEVIKELKLTGCKVEYILK